MGFEILITNDDGYTAKGVNVITKLLSQYGNVTVIAPKEGQSGMSTALSFDKPLRLYKISQSKGPTGNTINIYALNGTPADCVKMAMNKFFINKKPNLLVSGINHGSNASVGSVYSGTLGACIEGTIYGIPSIGLSLDAHISDADFTAVEQYLNIILKNYFRHPAKPGIYLNINFPSIPVREIKGIKIASQGKGMWINEFTERTDPRGENYYWMKGEFLDKETLATGDHILLKQGYITIVPHKVDNTDYTELANLSAAWQL
ncbi:MAG: 5'/3'-nucleotidase SurE [Bacteroidales bacterium]